MKTLTWVVLGAVLSVGCRGGGDGEGGLDILPHASPIRLGQMYPLGENEPEPGTSERVPHEFVLLLQTDSDAVEIEEVCLVGATEHFTLEGPVPESPRRDEDAALRITYDRPDVGGPDHAAVVVQSNAENFPTLVVPVCAQVVAEGSERIIFECESPVTVPEGEKDETLCN